jgi:hypothetical protein
MEVRVVGGTPKKRMLRNPQNPFNLVVRPWQIQPCMIHPVLPGETLKNLMLMSRVVSDPVKDKLMGWWCEYFFFYVKHRDLDIRDNLVAMHLDQASDPAVTLSTADNPLTFYNAGTANQGIDYVQKCLDTVVKWYFRDAEEPPVEDVSGLPVAKCNFDGWWESMRLQGDNDPMPGALDGALPGDVPAQPTIGLPTGYATQYAQWEAMVAAGITQKSFEDYLRSWGVKVDDAVDEEQYRPELLRYVRDFTYPTNTVEPTTGVPTSAAIWTVSERADKDRLFKEPGFIFGCQVIRPKVYLKNVRGTFSSYMVRAFDWLPQTLADEPFMSLRSFQNNRGPAPRDYGDTYWTDIKDYLMYGEQFLNHDQQRNVIDLPNILGNPRYPGPGDITALFPNNGASPYIRTDGLISMSIASSIRDTSL